MRKKVNPDSVAVKALPPLQAPSHRRPGQLPGRPCFWDNAQVKPKASWRFKNIKPRFHISLAYGALTIRLGHRGYWFQYPLWIRVSK
jgi:hypothetical protein